LGIFRVNASFGELRSRDFMEEMLIRGEDLPFMAKITEVVEDGNAIASKSVAGLEVAQHTNAISK